MNRDDIIRMAREAGIRIASPMDTIDPRNVYPHELERFATLVAAEKDKQIAFLKDSHDAIRELAYKTGAEEEREACARIAMGEASSGSLYGWPECAYVIAKAIRARGKA